MIAWSMRRSAGAVCSRGRVGPSAPLCLAVCSLFACPLAPARSMLWSAVVMLAVCCLLLVVRLRAMIVVGGVALDGAPVMPSMARALSLLAAASARVVRTCNGSMSSWVLLGSWERPAARAAAVLGRRIVAPTVATTLVSGIGQRAR